MRRGTKATRGPMVIRIVLGLVLPFAILGCSKLGTYDQRGGAAIAEAIRAAHSPVIQDVRYYPGDYLDPATIDIRQRPDVTRAEALTMMCTIAMPLVRAGDPPNGLGVSAFDSDLARSLATDADACPSATSP